MQIQNADHTSLVSLTNPVSGISVIGFGDGYVDEDFDEFQIDEDLDEGGFDGIDKELFDGDAFADDTDAYDDDLDEEF